MRPMRGVLTTSTIVGAIACSLTLAHQVGAHEETVTAVRRQALADVPGKQLLMATVDYLPGEASAPHRHAGSVFAYVLEGAVVSQLEGAAPVTYRVGQSWYEPPRTPHLVSRNASSTRPARLLAILVMDEGAEVKEPLPQRE